MYTLLPALSTAKPAGPLSPVLTRVVTVPVLAVYSLILQEMRTQPCVGHWGQGGH